MFTNAKEGYSIMWLDTIDKTLVINLEDRTDRLKNVTAELNAQRIPFERFPAIKNKKGAMGLFETFDRIFTQNQNAKRLLIFEDDARFLRQDTHEILDKCFDILDIVNWELFYLGGNIYKSATEFISPNVMGISSMYAMHSIVYSQRGIEKMNDLIYQVKAGKIPFQPIDVLVVQNIQPNRNVYAAFPMLCTQSPSYSNIENRRVNYEFLVKRYAQIKAPENATM